MLLYTWLTKGYALFLISSFEIGTPFIRMIAMTRLLDLRELGFASALAASYGMLEQITDIAVYRFVFSARREDYDVTLASAHALSVVRGVVVGALAVAASPLIAKTLSLGADWLSFAALGPIILIRSFEHLGPRVAERDYKYGAQLSVALSSNGLSLAGVIATAALTHNHNAIVVSLLGQMLGLVVASHAFADTRYRLAFFTPQFVQAFRFGYPLMLNGLGLSLASQGDRFLVGAMLGLPALGIYSVALLATIVPIAMISRISTTLILAALHNASSAMSALSKRLRISAQLLPIVHGGYALGIIALMDEVVPRVFGAQFYLSSFAIKVLAIGAFLRLIRGDPLSAVLLHERRTKRLAVGNASSIISLAFIALFLLGKGVIESAFIGRAFGELVAYFVTLVISQGFARSIAREHLKSVAGVLLLIGAISIAIDTFAPEGVLYRLIFLVIYAVAGLIWLAVASQPSPRWNSIRNILIRTSR